MMPNWYPDTVPTLQLPTTAHPSGSNRPGRQPRPASDTDSEEHDCSDFCRPETLSRPESGDDGERARPGSPFTVVDLLLGGGKLTYICTVHSIHIYIYIT